MTDLLQAITDTEDLTAWCAINATLIEDPDIEERVLDALGQPVPAHLAIGVPLLIHADGREPISLIQALLHHPALQMPRQPYPLAAWIPCGASVVEVILTEDEANRLGWFG